MHAHCKMQTLQHRLVLILYVKEGLHRLPKEQLNYSEWDLPICTRLSRTRVNMYMQIGF